MGLSVYGEKPLKRPDGCSYKIRHGMTTLHKAMLVFYQNITFLPFLGNYYS